MSYPEVPLRKRNRLAVFLAIRFRFGGDDFHFGLLVDGLRYTNHDARAMPVWPIIA